MLRVAFMQVQGRTKSTGYPRKQDEDQAGLVHASGLVVQSIFTWEMEAGKSLQDSQEYGEAMSWGGKTGNV